jgi:hypothetical protein
MDAFTSFAISQGLRLKELTMPAAATPVEVLRRFYIVLDLAEKDKGLLFYSFDNRVCGMCSSALPDIPGLSCSDMNVIKMAMARNNEDRSMVTWVHNDGYMAGRTGQDLPGFRKWLTTTSMSSLQCCVCYETNCRSRGGQGCTRCISWVCGACIKGMGRGGAFDCPVCRRDPRIAKVVVM